MSPALFSFFYRNRFRKFLDQNIGVQDMDIALYPLNCLWKQNLNEKTGLQNEAFPRKSRGI